MKRLLSVLLVAACGESVTEIPEVRSDLDRDLDPDITVAQLATVVDGNTTFAADLYRAVHGKPGNLFMSPHSISTALAMTYAGANSSTKAQMAATLHFEVGDAELHAGFNKLDLELARRGDNASGETIPFRLTTANALFGQQDAFFQQPFLDTLARNYGAGMRVLDFGADPEAARSTINGWVRNKTNDKIEELFPEGTIQDSTRLVLANAIYFTAAWHEPFETSATSDRTFTLVGGERISVPTMSSSKERNYAVGEGWRAAGLPYDGGQLEMVVVVPDSFADFEAALDGAKLAEISGALENRALDLTFPKFKFATPLSLKQTLFDLGMTDAFTDGAADFSGIDGTRSLVITDVVHQGFVAVDEKGTEAAAATGVVIGPTSVPERAQLDVDRPFVFYIVDRPTGAILFLGRVLDPRA